MQNQNFDKNVLREKEAAAYIGMSRSYLRQSRMNGDRLTRAPAPPWIQVGRAVRYLRSDLDDWLKSQRITAQIAQR